MWFDMLHHINDFLNKTSDKYHGHLSYTVLDSYDLPCAINANKAVVVMWELQGKRTFGMPSV